MNHEGAKNTKEERRKVGIILGWIPNICIRSISRGSREKKVSKGHRI
jgi:hypothetical protein